MVQSGRFGTIVNQSLILMTGGPSPGGVVGFSGARWSSGPSASPAWYKAKSDAARSVATGAGKFYFEVRVTVSGPSPAPAIGIAQDGTVITTTGNAGNTGRSQYFFDGRKRTGGAYLAYGATYTTGDVIGVAIEPGSGSLTGLRFWKNGVDQGLAYNNLPIGSYEPHFCAYANTTSDGVVLDVEPLLYLPAGYLPW